MGGRTQEETAVAWRRVRRQRTRSWRSLLSSSDSYPVAAPILLPTSPLGAAPGGAPNHLFHPCRARGSEGFYHPRSRWRTPLA